MKMFEKIGFCSVYYFAEAIIDDAAEALGKITAIILCDAIDPQKLNFL
jgi:hypothetical protein